ncbi:MAG: hypothetical protein AAFX65_05045 [Cyanobacteria bacterium J06638_7]
MDLLIGQGVPTVTPVGAIGPVPVSGRRHTQGPAGFICMEPTNLERTLQLTQLRDWCTQRLSRLALEWRMDDARALTAEHLESLEVVAIQGTLWMAIEPDG